ncbi:MAG: hypothetical protein ACK4MZ_06890 [Thermomonas haemolytica]
MSWDPFQRAVLAELGHDVYRVAAAPAAAAPVPATGHSAPAEAGSGAATGSDARDAALLAKLAQAARLSPQALLAQQTGIADLLPRLRTDPAAKRALWPRLRALRRGRA